jgi:methylated-DNA-protein-cysteine methyltransferase-like protein
MDLTELWDLVRQVPYGKCISYGVLGRALDHPTSGRMVGRWMANCPNDVPWWRVVSKNGSLALYKRDPYMGANQRQRLLHEGVPFSDDRVNMGECLWEP